MLLSFKNELKLSFTTIWQMCAVFSGLWLVFYILFGVMTAAMPKDAKYTNLGVILSATFGTMFLIAIFASNFCIQFETAIKMSVPRKRFLLNNIVIGILSCILYSALIMLIGFIDKLLQPIFFKNIPAGSSIPISLPAFGILFLVMIVALIFGMLMGALLQRFGKKAFWIIWAIYMLFVFVGVNVGGSKSSFMGQLKASFVDFVKAFTLAQWGIFGAAVALLIAAISVIILRKASVKA